MRYPLPHSFTITHHHSSVTQPHTHTNTITTTNTQHLSSILAQKYSLISSSLTADGVSTPRSVKRRVMYEGGV
eukprot:m.29785 g.29785  ORF g.29785 m.29785 type:complete len:73 (-) comp10476_c0_seq2:881-1099(-)